MSELQKSFFLLVLLGPFVVFSQVNDEKVPLVNVLFDLQEKYNYRFSYADYVINGIFVKEIPNNSSFDESINFLKKETGLYFHFLDNNVVAIQNRAPLNMIICGYIFDSESKQPLEYATLNGSYNSTITDSTGFFKLKVNQDEQNIYIRHLGYLNLTVAASSLSKEKCTPIYMNLQTYSISSLEVFGYISKGISKLPDGTFKINYLDFGILPGLIETDVLKTLQALPGVQSINETVSTINIRGGTNDQNLLLWDGIKMYQSGHFFGLVSAFNPTITTNASLIKNGTSVEYSDGVSGTISMKTNSNINKTTTGNIGLNFINADGFLDVNLGDKSSLQLSVRKAINGLVETPTYSNYYNRILQNTEVGSNSNNVVNSNIEFDFYDIDLRWLYDISSKDQLRVNFINIHNKLVYHENIYSSQIDESKESSLYQNSIAGGIYYKRKWNSRFLTDLQIIETDYKLKAINSDIIKKQKLLQENRVSETSVKLNTKYSHNSQLLILNGYQFTENGTTNLSDINNPRLKQLEREVIREHGLYTQLSYESNNNKTNINVGARYSYIEKFNKHLLEPRLSLNYSLFRHLNITAAGELKHQYISQIVNYQNDFLGIEKRRWRLSNNADVPIIMSRQLSVGMDYNKKGWLLSFETYYKEVSGITSQSQGFLNQYIFEKAIGSYNIKGLEILINKRNKRFSNWLSYSYMINEYTFKDFQEINFPNNLDISHVIIFGSSVTLGDFKASIGMNWFTGKPTTKPIKGNEIIDGEINYENANESNQDNYLRLDFSATYSFNISNSSKAYIGFSLWNSLNRQNTLYDYYIIDNNIPLNIEQTSLSITPNLSFKVQFGSID